MNTRAVFILKFFIWVLFIGANVLSLIALVTDWREFGISYWAIAYAPMNLAYLCGGIYVIKNFDFVLSHFRMKLIQALIALFVVDTLYAAATAIASKWYPNSFNPSLQGATDGMLAAGAAVGFGVSLLVLFVMIRLINAVANTETQKPPVWMTIFAWTIIFAMVGVVVGFSLGE